MDEGSRIPQSLRELRRAAGLTQEQAAEGLSVDKITISRWETGARQIKARDFERAKSFYAEARRHLAETVVPRGTRMVVRESGSSFGVEAGDDVWSPNAALLNQIPKRAYDVAIAYCRRLQAAGLPVDAIEDAERLMVDNRFAKANKREKRELSDDDWVLLVDAMWDAIRETYERKGVKV